MLYRVKKICIVLFIFFSTQGNGICFDGDSELFFSKGGVFEFENFFSTERGNDFDEANRKNELRLKLMMKAGNENMFLYAAPDFYVSSSLLSDHIGKNYSYKGNLSGTQYNRVSGEETEIAFNEFYLNFLIDNIQVRIGNQIVNWGTADVFNPTSYFNPIDIRETFTKVDSHKFGVPLVSGIVFFDNYTAELVYMPFHVTSDRAKNNEFWAISPDNFIFPLEVSEDKKLDNDFKNSGYGVRFTTTVGSLDMALSGYHGPDNEPSYVPKGTLNNIGSPLAIEVEPQYYIVDKVGADFAWQYDKIVFQFEAAFSPNRKNIVNQAITSSDEIVLPYIIEKTKCFTYSAGFNYFIPVADYFKQHDGELVFTLEWNDTEYSNKKLMESIYSDYISLRLEDTFLEGRLTTKCTSIIDTKYNGMLIWPEISYGFNNGVSLIFGYFAVSGSTKKQNEVASIFSYIENNDIVSFKVKYEF